MNGTKVKETLLGGLIRNNPTFVLVLGTCPTIAMTSTLSQAFAMGLKKEDYDFYLDLRRYGSVRHAGFGLGFERCVMYLTGMANIRDVLPFPRTVKNCEL